MKSIVMIGNSKGAGGIDMTAGNSYTVADGVADDLVNRKIAKYSVSPSAPPQGAPLMVRDANAQFTGFQDPVSGGIFGQKNLSFPTARRRRKIRVGDSRKSQFGNLNSSADTPAGNFVVTAGGGLGGYQGSNTATMIWKVGGNPHIAPGMWVQVQCTGIYPTPSGKAGIPYNYAAQVLSVDLANRKLTFSTQLAPGDYSASGWQVLSLQGDRVHTTEFWVDAFSGQDSILVANYAIGGTTTASLALWQESILEGPQFDVCELGMGVNDIHATATVAAAYAAAQTAFANIVAFAQAILNYGAVISLEITYGMCSTTTNYTSTTGTDGNTYGYIWNAGLCELRRLLLEWQKVTPNVMVADSYENTINATGAMADGWSLNTAGDGLHFQPPGAVQSGWLALNQTLKSFLQNPARAYPVCALDDGSANDAAGKTQVQQGARTPNLFGVLAGTSGTLQNGATGTVPTGWTANANGNTLTSTAGETPLVPSGEISNAANFGTAWEVAMSTAASSTIYLNGPNIASNVVPGKWHKIAIVFYTKAAPVALNSLALQLYALGDNTISFTNCIDSEYNLATAAQGAVAMPLPVGQRFVYRSRFFVPAGHTLTTLQAYLRFKFFAAGSADFQIQAVDCHPIAGYDAP